MMKPVAVAALLALWAEPTAIPTLAKAPVLDGRISATEYGKAATVKIPVANGEAVVKIARHGGFLHIAATLPDTSNYWGDDFVISFDPDGSGGTTPDIGDRQWYLRRVLDSSVVFVVDAAARGRWLPPGTTPPLLGATRHTGDWDVASTSTAKDWSVELRVREGLIPKGATPRITFRTYNDKPRGWWSIPQSMDGKPTVERNPSMWMQLRLR